MSWDDDYMSDKFIQELEKAEELNKSKLNKSKRLCTRKEPQQQPVQQKPKNIMERHREEGLAKSIPSTNKGFAMLAKMGYKPGEGIGKNSSGISEPVGIEVKNDKKGFGKRRTNAEIIQEFQERLAAKINETTVESFRNRLAEEKMKKFNEIDLYKSQKVCKQLDENENIEPEEIWFWPEVQEHQDEEEENDNEVNDEEETENIPAECKLEVLTEYLRFKHLYCIWCAVKYNDIEDLQDNCPGNTRNEH